MSAPALSVAVLNYNYARYLRTCLDSIMSQSFRDFELVIIDDNSTDESLAVITPYLSDPRVRLIHHERNLGFVRSLIEASESSASEYFTVVSADDFVASDRAFERQMALMRTSDRVSFAYAAWHYVDGRDHIVSSVTPWHEDHVWSGEREFRELCTRYYVLHSGTIIRRAAYRAVGGYDAEIKYTLDNTLWLQLCGTGDIAYVSEPSYGYRTHGSNMSHSPDAVRATLREFLRLVDLGFAALPEGPTKRDGRLRRRARSAALVSMATMHTFAGKRFAGLHSLWLAARLSPFETLLQRRFVSIAFRMLFGRRAFEAVRVVVRR